jgi:hypothetical protein
MLVVFVREHGVLEMLSAVSFTEKFKKLKLNDEIVSDLFTIQTLAILHMTVPKKGI